MLYLRILSRITSLMNVPFGYTLAVWSSGALALHQYGPPLPTQALLFVAGGIAAYLLGALLGRSNLGKPVIILMQPLAVLNLAPLGAAGAVALVLPRIAMPDFGYPAAGFLGTAVYILTLAALLSIAAILTRQPGVPAVELAAGSPEQKRVVAAAGVTPPEAPGPI